MSGEMFRSGTMRAPCMLAMGLLLGACFEPTYPVGIPCSGNDTCPPGQTCDLDGICRVDPVEPPGPPDGGSAPEPPDAGSTPMPPDAAGVCGDGIVQPERDEECDSGGVSTAECDADCTFPVCGDGFVNPEADEVCDDGNQIDTDDCTGCQLASCDDGFQNADEIDVDCGGHCGPGSCDPGQACGGNDDCAFSECLGGTCTQTERLVFVSSELFTGDLGGVDGADGHCQRLADAAGLPGTYRAWVSSVASSPATRFFQSPVPYELVDGTVIADDWADLTDGSLQNPINLTEQGSPPPAAPDNTCDGGTPTIVWSGTLFNGTSQSVSSPSQRCQDWTSTEGGGRWGNAALHTISSWSAWCSGGFCEWRAPIYCFQQ